MCNRYQKCYGLTLKCPPPKDNALNACLMAPRAVLEDVKASGGRALLAEVTLRNRALKI